MDHVTQSIARKSIEHNFKKTIRYQIEIKLSMVAHVALSRMHWRQQSRSHINVVCDLTFKTAAITAAVTQ